MNAADQWARETSARFLFVKKDGRFVDMTTFATLTPAEFDQQILAKARAWPFKRKPHVEFLSRAPTHALLAVSPFARR